MRILFHISGYKNPEQFAWLYGAIYNKQDLFVIHVDQKSPRHVHEGFHSIVAGNGNTHFIPSLPIVWGGTGLIQSELNAVKFALDVDPDWQYLVNLSAQDYPLLSVAEIRARLSQAWPNNFVECKPISEVHWRIRKRLWFRHFDSPHRRYITPIPRVRDHRVEIGWYGAWWHILTRGFCQWWATEAKAEAYFNALHTAGMPDEFLIQNMIKDSPFQHDLVPQRKHAIIWCNPGDPLSASAHPNVLTMRDSQYLEDSEAFFARKFDQTIDPDILRVLAQKIGGRLPAMNSV